MEAISPITRQVTEALPVTTTLRSDLRGWTSMLVHQCESPSRMDTTFETLATPDPVVKQMLNTSNRWEIHTAQGWEKHYVSRGCLCFTQPQETHRLRWWQQNDEPLRMIHLYIPHIQMQEVADEMQISHGRTLATGPFFSDPVVANLVAAAAQAVRDGASDTYAASAATLIAYHLQAGEADFARARRSLGHISDKRLLRVLDFVEANYDKPLSLEALASEAGISRYHFATVFKRALGTSPHQHVQEVRLRCSRAMLKLTDRSIFDIAVSCGFGSASHFSAVFRADCGESPTSFRARHRVL